MPLETILLYHSFQMVAVICHNPTQNLQADTTPPRWLGLWSHIAFSQRCPCDLHTMVGKSTEYQLAPVRSTTMACSTCIDVAQNLCILQQVALNHQSHLPLSTAMRRKLGEEEVASTSEEVTSLSCSLRRYLFKNSLGTSETIFGLQILVQYNI